MRYTMKAIFGKLSILCFAILVFIVCVIYADGSMKLAMLGYLTSLITTVGLVLGYLSALKQETPKCYRYIGFYINLAVFPFLAFSILVWTFLTLALSR